MPFLDPLEDLVTRLDSNIPWRKKFSLEWTTAIRVVSNCKVAYYGKTFRHFLLERLSTWEI